MQLKRRQPNGENKGNSVSNRTASHATDTTTISPKTWLPLLGLPSLASSLNEVLVVGLGPGLVCSSIRPTAKKNISSWSAFGRRKWGKSPSFFALSPDSFLFSVDVVSRCIDIYLVLLHPWKPGNDEGWAFWQIAQQQNFVRLFLRLLISRGWGMMSIWCIQKLLVGMAATSNTFMIH